MAKHANPDLHFRGELQTEAMQAVWKLGEATVDDVRGAQPLRRRSAYNTVQTVLNRLVDRGLLQRQRRGRAFVYSPKIDESELLKRSIGERLAMASPDARRIALIEMVEDLEPGEVDEVARRANQIRRSRDGG